MAAAEVARVLAEADALVKQTYNEMAGNLGEESPKSTSAFRESLRKGKRKGKWNGRVTDLTMNEYRSMKWGLDAGYRAALRTGPKWSFRGSLTKPLRSNSDGMLDTDPSKAYDACYGTAPKFSIGKMLIGAKDPLADNPGPQYLVPSTMDPKGHPTIWKSSGSRFGCEVLQVNDEEGPAPGQYNQEAFKHSGQIRRAAIWTCQGREAWREPVAAPGPVPGEYKVEKATRLGKITPLRFSFYPRLDEKGTPLVPAKRLMDLANSELSKELRLKMKKLFSRDGLAFDDMAKLQQLIEQAENEGAVDFVNELKRFQAEMRDFFRLTGPKDLGPGPGHYKLPNLSDKNAYPDKEKPAYWKFGQEPRGLLPL